MPNGGRKMPALVGLAGGIRNDDVDGHFRNLL
jgi:hypothetical protein